MSVQVSYGPRGFQEVKAPRFPDNRHIKVVRLSALRTGRLYTHEIFVVLTSVGGWVGPWVIAERITSMKNSIDTIGNRTRDLPACEAVTQPLRHRVPQSWIRNIIIHILIHLAINSFWTKRKGNVTSNAYRISKKPTNSSEDSATEFRLTMYSVIHYNMGHHMSTAGDSSRLSKSESSQTLYGWQIHSAHGCHVGHYLVNEQWAWKFQICVYWPICTTHHVSPWWWIIGSLRNIWFRLCIGRPMWVHCN